MTMDQDTSPSTFAEPTGDTSSIDVDSLMSSIESGQGEREIPMSSEPAASTQQASPTQAQAAKPQAASPTPQEIEFNWNGKQIKAPFTDPRIKQWASQGYDYAQRMAEFKTQQEQFQQQQAAIKALEERYRPVEEYAEKNPEWWAKVQQAFEAAQSANPTGAQPDQMTAALEQKLLKALESKLGPVEQFVQAQQAKEVSQQREAADQRLDQAIKSVQEQFKDLDWNGLDAEGKTLEIRVLEHCQKLGIDDFRAGFRDFYHDELIKRAEERGKSAVVKERQRKTKLGLLDEGQAPKRGIQPPSSLKDKSYDELLLEGVDELGISLSG